ncbi:MAG: MBL fold metallo-hydrolase [Bdellovibrionales bacterium]|nr:MBL fold metallo-hydrolase [Bdellovibrionales bacterium]
MRFSVLSSGSKANSTFVEVCSKRILLDCGLSAKEACRRLVSLGVDPETLDAIVVTHEHGDHIRGVGVLSRKLKLPVYSNFATAEFLDGVFAQEIFESGRSFWVGGAEIKPFSIVHDAADPVGIVVEGEGLKFALATDLGKVTSVVTQSLKGAHALVVESNHDPEMLLESEYPWVLKQRISSSHGHLSNQACSELIFELLHPELFHIVLGHLSENCNTPDRALECSKRVVGNLSPRTLICGNAYEPTPLFEVEPSEIQQRLVG